MGWGFFGEIAKVAVEAAVTSYASGATGGDQGEDTGADVATQPPAGGNPDFDAGPAAVLGHQAAALLDRFEQALDGLRERVIAWLRSMMGSMPWLFEIVKAIFDALWEMARQFVRKAAETLRGINAPQALQQAAQEWRDGPTAAVGELVPVIQQKASVVDESWTDEGGRAYAARVPAQVAAVVATHELGEKTAQTLDDAARALTAFYAEVSALIGRLYTAVKSNSGNVFSLGTLAAIFSGGLGDIVRAVKGIIAFSEEMERLQQQLAEAVTSSAAFPDGKWPVAAHGASATPPDPATPGPKLPDPTVPDPTVREDAGRDAAYA